jgi:hypothetical protein
VSPFFSPVDSGTGDESSPQFSNKVLYKALQQRGSGCEADYLKSAAGKCNLVAERFLEVIDDGVWRYGFHFNVFSLS